MLLDWSFGPVQALVREGDVTMKPPGLVIKHRLLATSFLGWHAINCVLWFTTMERNPDAANPEFPVWLVLSTIPSVLGSLYYVFNLAFYKWDYSRLGKKALTFPSTGGLLLELAHSYGCVGWLQGSIPFFGWTVFEDGLKVKMLGVGEAWVAREDMDQLKRCKLKHHSPVIRGPLTMPPAVAEKVKEMMAPRSSLEEKPV